MTVYTLGIWTVRPGREDDFVDAWADMGRRTKLTFPDAAGTLLRDHERPGRFISFGPWKSAEEVAAWRESDAFKHGVAEIGEFLESFEPHTMELVTKIE